MVQRKDPPLSPDHIGSDSGSVGSVRIQYSPSVQCKCITDAYALPRDRSISYPSLSARENNLRTDQPKRDDSEAEAPSKKV